MKRSLLSVVILMIGTGVFAAAPGAGSLINLTLTKEKGYADSCQAGSQIDEAAKECDGAAKKAQEACKSSSASSGSQKNPGTTNGSANDGAQVNADGSSEASKVAAVCCPAAAACASQCGEYAGKTCSPLSQEPSDLIKASQKQPKINPDAQQVISGTCAQAKVRCGQANAQAKANDEAKKSDKDQGEKSKGDGGGMPQIPQIPQGGGGGGDQSPQAAAADPATNAEENCTTHPTSEKCLCLSNPRGCAQGASVATGALGAASGEGSSAGLGDAANSSGPSKSLTPASESSLANPAGPSGAGAGSGGGGVAGGSGGSNTSAGKPESTDKKKSLLSASSGGSEGGGGGASGGSSGFGGDEENVKKSGLSPKGFAVTGVRAPVQGLTKSGGRTNWEKVKIRYTENTGTFMKDEKDFFCIEPSCKKSNHEVPTAALAAAAVSGNPSTSNDRKPAAATSRVAPSVLPADGKSAGK